MIDSNAILPTARSVPDRVQETWPHQDRVGGSAESEHAPTRLDTRRLLLLLGIPIDDLTMDEALDRVERFVEIGRKTGKTHQIATVNADFVTNAIKDPELRLLLQEADMATADGMPLVWGARMLGVKLGGRVAGSDLVPALAERAAARGMSIYFLGAAPGVAEEAAAILRSRHPQLIVAGVYAPPYSSVLEMDPAILDNIKAAKPDILFVAFGNPKQEKWIGMYRYQVGVPVMMGVGAAFDFIAGNQKRAPVWMQRSGLEWFYRLIQEPSRMVRRYGVDFATFGTHFARQWWHMRGAGTPPAALPHDRLMLVDGTAVVQLDGRLTLGNRDGLASLLALGMEESSRLVLNCQEVEFLDSSAIGTLVGFAKQARDGGGDLELVAVPETIYHTLRLLRLDTFFVIHRDMTDALRRAGEGETTSAALTATSWQVIEGPRRLDALTAAELETLWTARVADNSRMVIDLSETVLLTSAGLALLGKLSRLAREHDGQLRVAGCSKDVRRVMELARFDQVLTIYPDRAAALADSPQVNGN